MYTNHTKPFLLKAVVLNTSAKSLLLSCLVFVLMSGSAQAEIGVRFAAQVDQSNLLSLNKQRPLEKLRQSFSQGVQKGQANNRRHSVVADHFVSAQKTQAGKLKSRRQVIEEVERDYQAKVLKVSFDSKAGVYEVRILQSDGRVRTIRVSANN